MAAGYSACQVAELAAHRGRHCDEQQSSPSWYPIPNCLIFIPITRHGAILSIFTPNLIMSLLYQ